MSQDWEVKKVSKSGSDYDITVGPKDSPEGMAMFIAGVILTVATMNLFGLTGFGWGIGLWFGFVALLHFFPLVMFSLAGIIFVSILLWAIFS